MTQLSEYLARVFIDPLAKGKRGSLQNFYARVRFPHGSHVLADSYWLLAVRYMYKIIISR